MTRGLSIRIRPGTKPFPVVNVLKNADAHICGICRRPHTNPTRAAECLRSCAANLLAAGGPHHPSFDDLQCRFCRRRHATLGARLRCMRACRRDFRDRLERVLAFYGVETAPQIADSWHKRSQEKVVSRILSQPDACSATQTKAPGVNAGLGSDVWYDVLMEDASSSIEEQTSDPTPSPAQKGVAADPIRAADSGVADLSAIAESMTLDLNDPPPSSASGATEGRKKRPGEAKALRRGAKYQCGHCRGEYFTRLEAESCYDKHPG